MTTVMYCTDTLVYTCDGCSLSTGCRSKEVLYGAHVETPGRAERAAPMLQHLGGDWALHFLTDPARRCRSQNHHTGPDSTVKVGGRKLSYVTHSRKDYSIGGRSIRILLSSKSTHFLVKWQCDSYIIKCIVYNFLLDITLYTLYYAKYCNIEIVLSYLRCILHCKPCKCILLIMFVRLGTYMFVI